MSEEVSEEGSPRSADEMSQSCAIVEFWGRVEADGRRESFTQYSFSGGADRRRDSRRFRVIFPPADSADNTRAFVLDVDPVGDVAWRELASLSKHGDQGCGVYFRHGVVYQRMVSAEAGRLLAAALDQALAADALPLRLPGVMISRAKSGARLIRFGSQNDFVVLSNGAVSLDQSGR